MGIGTHTPIVSLHVKGNTYIQGTDPSTVPPAETPTEALYVDGNVYIAANLELGSSRAYKDNIQPIGATEAFEALKGLQPVRYHYKSDPAEESLGFIAEDVPALVATDGRKSLSPMDFVAVLTRVVQEQQKTIEGLAQKVVDLERELKANPRDAFSERDL